VTEQSKFVSKMKNREYEIYFYSVLLFLTFLLDLFRRRSSPFAFGDKIYDFIVIFKIEVFELKKEASSLFYFVVLTYCLVFSIELI
jgi:hypothetical protein